MKPWLEAMASAVGFHKPIGGPSYRTNPGHEPEQGGTLVSSSRESAGANPHSPPNRRPAVVGLAAPPYGLPSTDPTTRPSACVQLRCTPVPSVHSTSAGAAGRHVPSAPTVLTAKCGWSAHADNRPRSEFPLDPLLSRGDRPQQRPACFRPEDVPSGVSLLPSAALSAPRRWSP